jgi:hypothetical protein
MIDWSNATAVIVGVVFIPVSIFLLMRRRVDFRRLKQHNDIVEFIYVVISVI